MNYIKIVSYCIISHIILSTSVVAEEERDYESVIETQLFSVLLSWYSVAEPDFKDLISKDCARISFIYYMQKVVKDDNPNLRTEKIIRTFVSKLTDSQKLNFEDPFRWKQDSIVRFVSPFEMDLKEYEKNIPPYISYFNIRP